MTSQSAEMIRIILGRRSVRSFRATPVEPYKVETLLACAFAAPISKDRRPCHFIVIDDRSLLDELGKAYGQARMFREAPLAVAVCVDVKAYRRAYDLHDGTWMEDGAAAMENLLLAARALELEGVWVKVADRHPRESEMAPLLQLPEGVRCLSLALIGYGREELAPHEGLDETRLHRNGW